MGRWKGCLPGTCWVRCSCTSLEEAEALGQTRDTLERRHVSTCLLSRRTVDVRGTAAAGAFSRLHEKVLQLSSLCWSLCKNSFSFFLMKSAPTRSLNEPPRLRYRSRLVSLLMWEILMRRSWRRMNLGLITARFMTCPLHRSAFCVCNCAVR